MSTHSINVDERLRDYMLDVSLREHPVMRALRDETADHAHAGMQISPEQGQFMQMLVRMLGAKTCIEVGTFTGYSALAVALALPDGGRLVACDISEEFTKIGKPFWEKAGVADKIDLRIAPATESLDAMIAAGETGSYDFAFIDADKPGYPDYFERCLKLLRPGGVIAVDNIFMGGSAADPETESANAQAMRKFNAALKDDTRVEISLIPIGDGLTLARKV
ncbi:MAG: class I SAM-dependent methyltransferase [Rhodospirillales bacterium]|nr:class I SAM-dependent methyltransferase [Rhodospirillales bacterium]MBO6787335.1 class I SAM-dependent methyltransferase [Rhodospirillales bacterium]